MVQKQTRKSRKYFELSGNEMTMYQNVWEVSKADLRGKEKVSVQFSHSSHVSGQFHEPDVSTAIFIFL